MKFLNILTPLLFLLLFTIWYPRTTQAIVDPLSAPNNRFGIHIIQATPDESSPAASLVNSTGGDWGYITFLIEGKDKKYDKWQEFFNDLRRRHLIPIVRIATEPSGNEWKIPNPEDADSWADFLNSLNWPTKNRYIIIYNEPNHGTEWGGTVDATSYAQVLDKFIDAFKKRSEDFFILNAGLDASAPNQPPGFVNELEFLRLMHEAVPGIFEKLDGWVSHSYPNPGFVGSPNATGRGTVETWVWELNQLKSMGVTKNLPVFITETGWKHAEGINYDKSLPESETVGKYFEQAFVNAWNNGNIVAVTPFLLSYQEKLFDHFSFKKPDGVVQDKGFYPQYQSIQAMSKILGKPVQENRAQLTKGEIFKSLVAGQSYRIGLTFKNEGQSIWGDGDAVKLTPLAGGKELGIERVELPEKVKIEPGKEHTFYVNVKAPVRGIYNISLNLFTGSNEFESQPLQFKTEVKLPVVLQILGKLKWKDSAQGEYILKVTGIVGDSSQNITLDKAGSSGEIEAKYLLPDYSFEFILERPYYKPATVKQTLKPGLNVLDFGELQPALLPALLHPLQLWQLLPFSN